MAIKLKVCGMRESENMADLIKLKPDFMGMIFYDKSPRFISKNEIPKSFPETIKRVGVFVNETTEKILSLAAEFQFDYVQLHGEESVEQVKELKQSGLRVIKVFRVTDRLPEREMKPYIGVADYFLFDTKTPVYGGSGQKFDWSILTGYREATPYFISGGIDLPDLDHLLSLALPGFMAVDVNSRFEISPGVKDIQKIKQLKARLS